MITKNSPGATENDTSSAAAFGFVASFLPPNQPGFDSDPPRGP